MNVEENRLKTFTNWPANAPVGADRIAKAGFYYTGIGLEVQCFLCGTQITEWNYRDQAMVRHRIAAPDCSFVKSPSSTCNVPLLPPSIADGHSSTATVEQAQSESSTENQLLLSKAVKSQDSQKQYRTMRQRLKSFTNWPISHIVSPERLAKAGLFYLQKSDMVACAFCEGIIMKWEPGDDPEREHRTHFPNCDFYMRQDNEDDIYEDIIESSNVKLMPGATTDLKDLGIQAHRVPQKHATYEERLRTFQNWPQEQKQTPEMLATAGFYYFGVDDLVRCFHCDGGLLNWMPTDDVWVEHAKWFPKCGFVNLVQGPEFIKRCVDSRPPLDPAITASVPEDDTEEISETPPASLSAILPPTRVTDIVLQELLHTPPAMEALEIGCQVGGVKRALKKRMEETGKTYEDVDELIAAVLLENQDGTENQTSDSSIDNTLDLLQYLLTQILDCTSSITGLAAQTSNSTTSSANDSENSNTCAAINGGNEAEESESATQKCEVSDNEDKEVHQANINSNLSSASLEEENRKLKEARLCKVCMDRELTVVFLPCGHLATCIHCSGSLKYCLMCRQEIRATVRTFLS